MNKVSRDVYCRSGTCTFGRHQVKCQRYFHSALLKIALAMTAIEEKFTNRQIKITVKYTTYMVFANTIQIQHFSLLIF